MDRETVIRDLEYLVSFGGASQQSMVMKIATEALILLKEQETVKPKTGHWIEYEGMQGKYYDCSVCDYSLMEIHRGMKYCPYCGAKMDNQM